MHASRRILAASAILAAIGGSTARRTHSQSDTQSERLVLPILFHVATSAELPVVPAELVPERLARANAIFAPYGIAFEQVGLRALDARHAVIETRSDRDALGAYATPGVIDCFVVRSLHDVDDPTQMRRGVHWRSRSHPGKRFVIVSAAAGENVLAHELGHYLGNPKHSEVPGNLMSYAQSDGLPVLDPQQLRRMRRSMQAALRRGELRPLERAPAKPTR